MCLVCDWEDFAEGITGLLDDPAYEWAADTLEGILEWVGENEHATPGQKEAVENIVSAAEERG